MIESILGSIITVWLPNCPPLITWNTIFGWQSGPKVMGPTRNTPFGTTIIEASTLQAASQAAPNACNLHITIITFIIIFCCPGSQEAPKHNTNCVQFHHLRACMFKSSTQQLKHPAWWSRNLFSKTNELQNYSEVWVEIITFVSSVWPSPLAPKFRTLKLAVVITLSYGW